MVSVGTRQKRQKSQSEVPAQPAVSINGGQGHVDTVEWKATAGRWGFWELEGGRGSVGATSGTVACWEEKAPLSLPSSFSSWCATEGCEREKERAGKAGDGPEAHRLKLAPDLVTNRGWNNCPRLLALCLCDP